MDQIDKDLDTAEALLMADAEIERLRYALTQIDKMTVFPDRYGPDAIGQVARQALTCR